MEVWEQLYETIEKFTTNPPQPLLLYERLRKYLIKRLVHQHPGGIMLAWHIAQQKEFQRFLQTHNVSFGKLGFCFREWQYHQSPP